MSSANNTDLIFEMFFGTGSRNSFNSQTTQRNNNPNIENINFFFSNSQNPNFQNYFVNQNESQNFFFNHRNDHFENNINDNTPSFPLNLFFQNENTFQRQNPENNLNSNLESIPISKKRKIKKIKKSLEEKYFKIAEISRKKKNYVQSIKYYEKSILIIEKSKYYYKMSLSLLKLNNYIEARKSIKKAIFINPNKGDYYQVLGYLDIEKCKITHNLNLAKNCVDLFNTAFNLKKNKINNDNYWNARKLVFLMKREFLDNKKEKLKNYFKHLYNEKFFKNNNKKVIPDYLNCCISLDLMNNPYQTTSGYSYEKNYLFEHLQISEEVKDPLTGILINKKNCFGNKILQKIIFKYLKKQPWAFKFEVDFEDFKTINFGIDYKLFIL